MHEVNITPHSTWGTKPTNWRAETELFNLEALMHQPLMRVVTQKSPPRLGRSSDIKSYLELDAPAYLSGQFIEMRLTAHPKVSTSLGAGIRTVEQAKQLAVDTKSYEIDTRSGRWQGNRFTLPLGISSSTDYQLTIRYPGLYGGKLTFVGKGAVGDLIVNTSDPETSNMTPICVREGAQ